MVLSRAIELLWPLAYIAGLLVSWVYYRKRGKAIVSLLFVYFALGLYSATLAPYLNRLWISRHTTEITAEQLARYEAYREELDGLRAKYPEIAPARLALQVSFPFGQILLVTIFFVLGRQLLKGTPDDGFRGTRQTAPAKPNVEIRKDT